jgi:energy-converting hydrogenase Eha subunit B
VSTAKVIALFVVGLLLAALVFPVAFFASAALGYIFGVIALAIGVWLAVKRAGKTLPLVLGIVLAVITLKSIPYPRGSGAKRRWERRSVARRLRDD